MKTLFALCLVAVALSGCATCEQHPRTCVVVGAWIAGSVAIIASHHDDRSQQAAALTDPSAPPCTMQPNGSCR